MSINLITLPLPGERVVALSPEDTTAAATDWLRRPNLFPGRALTDLTLQGRQRWQAGRIAVRGQAFTPGIAHGLETSHVIETTGKTSGRVRLLIEAGQGLAVSGEDVVLNRRTECLLRDLPVAVQPAWLESPPAREDVVTDTPASESESPGTPSRRVLANRVIATSEKRTLTFAEVTAVAGDRMPDVGVLVLQPVTVDASDFDPNDPCDRCPTSEKDNLAAFEDWRIGDGVRLLWYPWPTEWQPLPTTALRQRNALAYQIFDAEGALAHGEALPWEEWGVPIALMSLDTSGGEPLVRYIDRAAVARQGGHAREARLMLSGEGKAALAANSRLPALWQARIEQFAEQIAGMGEPSPDPAAMADPFLKLPPCGLLPKNALELANFRSEFFPSLFTLDAVPVPIEQVDLAVREAAPMAPLDLAVPERVRLMVPVSQASWEPRLLHQETIDPEFQQTLDRFLLTRARLLGERQCLRSKGALLAHALDGRTHTFIPYSEDPLAVEPESLLPWGPPPGGEPPDGGGHRSKLAAGMHEHSFLSPGTPFALQTNESLLELRVWVYLDPDNPPRTLMLQWHVAGSHWVGAYWGENLIKGKDLIKEDGEVTVAPPLRVGDLPDAGRWVHLTVVPASFGLTKASLDGMGFTLYGGRVAYGMVDALIQAKMDSGALRRWFRDWFSNGLPSGAGVLGDEPWDFLSQNDLWAPFVESSGVVLGRPQVQPGGSGGHFEPARPGVHQHDFINAEPFPVTDKEILFAWVYLDPNDPPRELMLQWQVLNSWNHRAYWGFDLIAWGSVGKLAAHRAGSLPRPGEWVRLEVSAEQVGVAGQAVDGMAFTLFDGSAAFAGTGALDEGGTERVWFSDSLPINAKPTRLWEWLDNDALLEPTASNRIGIVETTNKLYDDPALAILSGQELAHLPLRGLEGFVAYLRARIDRADDLTDYGFLKVQTDIYRMRQLMLGSTDATRLAVSPALASIAKAETAMATQAQIASYVSAVKQGAAPLEFEPGPFPKPMMFEVGGVSNSLTGATQTKPGVALAAEESAPKETTAASLGELASEMVKTQGAYQPIYQAGSYSPTDVVFSRPLIGKAGIRTTAIAERLRDPASQEARDYALATRHETLNTLLRLADELLAEDSGVAPSLFGDLDVYGIKGDPFLDDLNNENEGNKKWVLHRKLADFVANRSLLEKLVSSPTTTSSCAASGPDEGTLFSEVADLSDNTVALLRQVEGRVKRYHDALTVCENALAQLRADYSATLARLSATEQHLAEARHDVAVTRALMAEEQARIEAINARRARVLEEEVRFLAFARPRQTSNLLAAPYRVVDPALREAPVPACLRAHNDVPDELDDMLRMVREAPASWFVRGPSLIDKLKRTDQLIRLVGSAQKRLPLLLDATPASTPVNNALGKAVSQVLSYQTTTLDKRATAMAALDVNELARASWKNIRFQVQEVVSLGDLIDGGHGKGSVIRRAAADYDDIAAICACLHAELCGVSASIRLDWAETMSQFEAAPNLRNLANLPRWSEIDSSDRRQMQAYADWLFSQVDAGREAAVALMNDVVRMCLLLASHAPVGRIIAGRLPRPIPSVRPGIRIPLVSMEPAKTRVGMQVMVYRAQEIVARAVIEDVGPAELSARVIYTNAAEIDLSTDVCVHFDAADVVSAAPDRTSGIFKRQEPIWRI